MNAKLIRTIAIGAGLGAACAAQAAEIVLFTGTNMTGEQIVLRGAAPNFDNGPYNDRARSAYVREGTWLLCTDSNFRGNCQTLGPGNYVTLENGLDRNVSSARPADGYGVQGGYNTPPAAYVPPQGYAPSQGHAAASVVLYEQPNFGGRGYPITREAAANLDRTQFNDRAQSIHVSNGYWIFCSDANFQGTCRTFGPGDYPSLEWSLNRSISSGRMISNDYPYTAQPNWR